MVLTRIRRRRFLPVVVLGLLLCGTAIPSAWHAADDDAYCERPLVSSGDSAAIGLATEEPDSGHCEVCHWLRSMRSLDVESADLRLSVEDVAPFYIGSFEIPESAPVLSLLARGPPA